MNKLSIKSMSNQISKKKKKGFTLVELIIVIAIIAILAAMAIPKFGAVRIDAKVSNDIAAAKNIQSTAAMLVANGTIKDNTDITVKKDDTEGEKIIERIDGETSPKAVASKNFEVKFKEGDVQVWVDDIQLAPATDTTTADYTGKANGKKSE
ncbi:prepilin-type N-terminal cleavage/methylation domain-containing protein [Clostridium botulinum]|nr:prepilin-type N-terminal cleavage/methylation domain-containing protein [Clostridium botulinum]